ncbi:hypothetical protein GE09DRAFT_1051636 [Coniochaeta sp. 2T2.1]|nr:hypothetical protein GE09DRAFT_1051636 [Coniochaeta sp. 2T2.1]
MFSALITTCTNSNTLPLLLMAPRLVEGPRAAHLQQVELVSILLEWHEEHGTHVEKQIVQSGFSTDEAFRIFVRAVKDYGIFLLDNKGHIATWNTGAELIMGYNREDIIGQHFSIFYGADDLAIRRPELELETFLRKGRAEDEG